MPSSNRKLNGAAIALILAASCASAPRWNQPIDTWGTMHSVMHEGRTEGKVELADVATAPNAIGIGALAGLAGEIVILDGDVWTSRALSDGARVETERTLRHDDQAALLVLTHVARWREHVLERDISASELDDRLRELAAESGLRDAETFPFVIRGELEHLDAHVLNGRCPYSGPGTKETDPIASARSFARGTLVGFYTLAEPGVLTHRGSRTHVHVVLDDREPFVGHVDAVRIRRGGRIALPDG
jgi:alpha-acetolactate decarboxylase